MQQVGHHAAHAAERPVGLLAGLPQHFLGAGGEAVEPALQFFEHDGPFAGAGESALKLGDVLVQRR